ncbi:MAG: hypothetical protein ABIN48_09230 [Ginsengibacter sp.]
MADHSNQKITWRCPSNIAIVKYWGKTGNQIPCNPSVSMTLSEACTEVELELMEKKSEGIELEYFFEGEKNEAFQNRVIKYLETNSAHFPLLEKHSFRINSHNTFPHSTGIASSASAFGAIALSLLDAENKIDRIHDKETFYTKASELARLGSGSACRSMFGGFASWGQHPAIDHSSDLYATPVKGVHENFQQMMDAILIVDNQPKKVSSSLGHSLMNDHPYAQNRFEQAKENTAGIIKTLYNGDYEEFIQIAESEALALHAMMMTSKNYYLLMKPGTIHAIEKITNFRTSTNIPVCFTLDAGPNVHILYPQKYKEEVSDFLKNELKTDLSGIIFDKIGQGPEKQN